MATIDNTPAVARPIRWKLIQAHVRCAAWDIASKLVLGVVYLAIISEGLRLVVPPLAQKIHKLPGLEGLNDYEATHALDLASLFSLFLLAGVWVSWDRVLRFWLGVPLPGHESWDSRNYQRFVVGLGGVMLATDGALFYAAICQMGWGSPSFSFNAVLATAAYLTVLIFATFVSINLHQRVQSLEEN